MKNENATVEVGKTNRLRAARESEHGLYLAAGDGEEVLLPNIYRQKLQVKRGDILEVFVYTDSEDRPVATTLKPYASRDEIAYLEAVDFKSYGVFLDWGLPKDLFVPLSQQKTTMEIGKRYIVRICLDEKTNRVYATQRIGRYLSRDTKSLRLKEAYDAMVIARTPLGYKVIVGNRYEGMIYADECFETLRVGEKRTVYIVKKRKDGKLDLSLRPIGILAKTDAAQRKVLDALAAADGQLAIGSKSTPEAIEKVVKLSKKDFKRALSALEAADYIVRDATSVRVKKGEEKR